MGGVTAAPVRRGAVPDGDPGDGQPPVSHGATMGRTSHGGRGAGAGETATGGDSSAVARRVRRIRPAIRGRRSASATSTTDAPATVLRLAVLLQAGVSPARAWAHLAATGDPVAAEVEASVSRGASLPAAIAAIGGDDWRDVAVAWRVASVVGAPLAECLRSLASALRDAQEAADDVRIALAEPAGTARLMGWLPLVAVALGAALGFDTFATLLGQPLGIACLAGGVVLIVASRRWTSRLVAGARGAHIVPGLDAELIAIALSGGVSIDRARTVVREAQELAASAPTGPASPAARPGAAGAIAGADAGPRDPGRTGRAGPRPRPVEGPPAEKDARDPDGVDSVLALSRSAGVPAVELLRAAAAHARHRARVEGRLRAARLSSRLLIPLGVCTLPAFLLLGVGPMLLSVMSTMSISL